MNELLNDSDDSDEDAEQRYKELKKQQTKLLKTYSSRYYENRNQKEKTKKI